ncbi:hypothetical protein BSL78_03065 [Apostichopus japonicus]|uniref:Dihydrolipoamide acetyltransferase component of pyruvate dehydrogenase complex n=1 Tax=Stichopus japonicus TaxID=307972 RepID=A0A2G8LIA8_STIJA|nr:hypothetical protein BSL78_03065 [Apostichopus japonicus]
MHHGQTQSQNAAKICLYSRPVRCLSLGAVNRYDLGGSHRGFQTSVSLCENIKIVETPPFAESVSEGDVRWDKVIGDAVAEDDVIGEIETDKTSIAVTSPVSGVIVEFLVEDGSTVIAGQQLVKIEITGGPGSSKAATPPTAQPAAPPAAAAKEEVIAPPPTTPPPIPPVPAGPMTIHAAPEIPSRPAVPPTATVQRKAAPSTPPPSGPGGVPLKATGTRTNKGHQHALCEMPVVNAVIDDLEIVYRDYIDISVAVATPKGLVVPVLRNVEAMNFADIERGLGELGQKASTGNLAIEDMDGGTFTVSNGGVFGSLYGTPIINPPQSAILGMHGIFDRPVAINGKVEIRPMMYVALTYDHRLIDGREAVSFLRKIKSGVEDPHTLLLEL